MVRAARENERARRRDHEDIQDSDSGSDSGSEGLDEDHKDSSAIGALEGYTRKEGKEAVVFQETHTHAHTHTHYTHTHYTHVSTHRTLTVMDGFHCPCHVPSLGLRMFRQTRPLAHTFMCQRTGLKLTTGDSEG